MKITFPKIASALLLSTLSTLSFAADIFYSKLAGSDRVLIDTAKMWKIPDNQDGPCLDGRCQGTLEAWFVQMKNENEGRKFLLSLADMPPHLSEPKLLGEFEARYKKWSATVKQGNVCYLVRDWSLKFVGNGYTVMTKDLGPGIDTGNYKDMTRVHLLESREYVRIVSNNKFLNLIPSNFINQPTFAKYQKYANIQDTNLRPALNVCGSFVGKHSGEAENKFGIGAQDMVYIFELTKPVEIVTPANMKVLENIPDEWYGYK